MEEFNQRIKKFGPNDIVNGQTINAVIEQLEHNINVVYGSVASSQDTTTAAEELYGNILDFDATGQKRFQNGGNLDALEKVLPWFSNTGSVSFDQTEILENDAWLKWQIPEANKQNLVLKRNMVVPESLRHQTILVAFKFVPMAGTEILEGERYDIYVNGVYAGTGDAGTINVEGKEIAKTIYGVYHLVGDESNLEVSLVRSPTNSDTPANYQVLIQSSFVGLHALGGESYPMNFPVSGSAFVGAGADITSFYDFENNAIRPIPSFLLNEERLEGTGSLTVNITSQEAEIRDTYYIGKDGSGNSLGVSPDNKMSVEDFHQIEAFPTSLVHIYMDQEDDYDQIIFDNANFLVHFTGNTVIDSMMIDDASSVQVEADNLEYLDIENIGVSGRGRLEINIPNGDMRAVNISGSEHSYIQMNVGTMSMPSVNGGLIHMEDSAKMDLNFVNNDKVNLDAKEGIGALLSPVQLDKYSFLNIDTENTNINLHIGRSDKQNESVFVNNHGHLNVKGFNKFTTGSLERKFVGKLHSSIEIETDIQADGGATAFTDLELALFSTFGSTLPPGTFNEDLIDSTIYEI